MGTLKTAADRENKSELRARVLALEKKTRLIEAVAANLVREIAFQNVLIKLLYSTLRAPLRLWFRIKQIFKSRSQS